MELLTVPPVILIEHNVPHVKMNFIWKMENVLLVKIIVKPVTLQPNVKIVKILSNLMQLTRDV
jgi:hypothetical protein